MKGEILDEIKDDSKFEFVGFGLRFVAYLIDIIPLVIVSFIIFYIFVGPELFSEKNMRVAMEINTIGDTPLRVGVIRITF